MSKRQTIDAWIADAMTDGEKDGPIAVLLLNVVLANGSEKEIDAVRFTGAKKWTPGELAARFRGKAEAYAQDLPGAQTFELLAFYMHKSGDDFIPRNEPEGRLPITIAGNSLAGNGGLVTEAPNDKGVTSQTMRHQEVMYQETTRMMRAFADRMADSHDAAMRQNAAMQKELNEAYRMMREMFLSARAEEHKYTLEETKAVREANMVNALMSYAPALINTLTGKEVFPQSTADSALIEGIVKKITPEALQVLAGVLPPEAMGLLAARMEQSFDKRLEAEKAAENSLSQLGGEKDVAGELTDGS